MVDISTLFSGETLKADDLGGKDHLVTIESVEVKAFDDGAKLVIRFQGRRKALVSNKTNSRRIALIAKSDDTDQWPGTKIVLRSEMVDFKGSPVAAIRVQPPAAAAPVAPRAGASTDLNDAIPFAPEWR
jgi:hypothetical protein